MSDVASAPRSMALRSTVLAHLLGSFAIGSVVFLAAFLVSQGSPMPYSMDTGFDVLDLTPELIVLVAVALALARPLRRFAWLLASAGTFGVSALFLQGTVLDRDQLFTLLAVCAGMQLGGVLLAIAQADIAERWAIAIGFGA